MTLGVITYTCTYRLLLCVRMLFCLMYKCHLGPMLVVWWQVHGCEGCQGPLWEAGTEEEEAWKEATGQELEEQLIRVHLRHRVSISLHPSLVASICENTCIVYLVAVYGCGKIWILWVVLHWEIPLLHYLSPRLTDIRFAAILRSIFFFFFCCFLPFVALGKRVVGRFQATEKVERKAERLEICMHTMHTCVNSMCMVNVWVSMDVQRVG